MSFFELPLQTLNGGIQVANVIPQRGAGMFPGPIAQYGFEAQNTGEVEIGTWGQRLLLQRQPLQIPQLALSGADLLRTTSGSCAEGRDS